MSDQNEKRDKKTGRVLPGSQLALSSMGFMLWIK